MRGLLHNPFPEAFRIRGTRLRRLSLRMLLLGWALCGALSARAQYYTWGADPPQKWSAIRTSDVKMVYPDTVEAVAQRTLHMIRTVRPTIGYGFTHGPMSIPFVMHPENFRSNGLVMYLPKRVEFLTSPAIESYSMPWYKQLVAHEYRHAVQYNNLDRGVIRVLSYLLGQQGSTVGLLCMPIWAMEGDAVMSETMSSSFGRGLQPSFTIGYRAKESVGRGRDGRMRRNIDKWFCGSYREYIPDHYELGYQICSYAWNRYDEIIWNKTARYGARNPYVLATTRAALGKYYRTDVNSLFRNTFGELQRFWDSLPRPEASTQLLTPLDEDNYTTYRWPQVLDDGTVLALRSDYARPERFVRIDPATGEERHVAYVGQVSTRPEIAGDRVWWTEYRRSTLFDQRVNSQLCRMDLSDGKPRTVKGCRRVLYPTAAGDDLGWVDYDPDGTYTVVVRRSDGTEDRFPVPDRKELHGLAWDDRTAAWYVIVTDDSGMWLGQIDNKGLHAVTQGAYITLSDLRAADGVLYYGSIASGRDEAHCYNLAEGREYRLTSSLYGSFAPSPADGRLLVTTYGRAGYGVAAQSLARRVPVAPSRLPQNVVNPPRRRWEGPNLDTVRFSTADSLLQGEMFPAKRYRKGTHLVGVHSWMPVAFDPFAAVDEHSFDVNLGVTLVSQNLLSNAEAFVSYGWNRSEGSLYNLGVRYFGLGLYFDLDASYGGNQLFYSLAQYDKETQKYVYQTRPAPDKYYSVGLAATLPLYLQRGYRTRQVSLSAAWNYSNGMVADLKRIEWNLSDGGISNLQHIGFRRGLHKLSFGAAFSEQVQLAHRDFAPRWGYTLSASYALDPSNADFCNLVSGYAQGYLPGIGAHHSLRLAATYQTSVGGYKFPSGYAPLSYRSTRLIPRGFSSADILSNDYLAFGADYQLPVWYPEGGINSVIYFKRVRLNFGGDYAQFRGPVAGKSDVRHRIWSVGGDLVLDINAFRQPASATSTVKISCYRPSFGGVWWSASFGLPF